ncbi:MAG: MATE family efflux transporter [Candidatus Omnitrophica bacterium]|nr:MATE family efflux transporter [Candidatus Omnitrophota bacterium]
MLKRFINDNLDLADQVINNRHKLRSYIAASWAICWPMMLIMFFEFLITIIDVYVAGTITKDIQAAYGFVLQLYFILTVIAIIINVGTVSIISRTFTGGDKARLSQAVVSAMLTGLVSGLACAFVGFFIFPLVITHVSVPDVVKHYAVPLIRFYSLGIIFAFPLINSNGILRSTKQVRNSLKTMAIVCTLNIALNFYLVFKTPLGFRGIAASTAISLMVGAFLNFTYIKRFIVTPIHYSAAFVKQIAAIGWPIGFLQIAWQTGTAVIYLILSHVPENNVEILAALTNGMRIESAIFLPIFAFNMSNAALIGNALGANNKTEAFRIGLVTAGLGFCMCIVLTLAVIANAPFLAGLVSHNEIVIRESVRYLYISMICEPIMAIGVILSGALNGAGDTKSVMIRVVASFWLIRIPLSCLFIFVLGLGAVSVWWAMNISLIAHATFIAQRYFSKKWLH